MPNDKILAELLAKLLVLLNRLRTEHEKAIALADNFSREHPEHPPRDCERHRILLAETNRHIATIIEGRCLKVGELMTWALQGVIEGKQEKAESDRLQGLQGLIEVGDALGIKQEHQS